MRNKKSQIDIWPAYSDFFSALAVLGIFSTFFIGKYMREIDKKKQEYVELQQRCTQINRYFELAEEILKDVKAEIDKAGIKVTRTADSLVLSENFLYFNRNDWSVPIFVEGEKGETKLLKIFDILTQTIKRKNAEGKLFIFIEGHTDSTQFKSQSYTNWNLSSERASTIVNWLKTHGIVLNMIPIGLADTKPASFCNHVANEMDKLQCNRRIEIKISPNYAEIEKSTKSMEE